MFLSIRSGLAAAIMAVELSTTRTRGARMPEVAARTNSIGEEPRQRTWLWWTVALLVAGLALGDFYYCVVLKNNDFLWHRGLGETFVNRSVYEFGRHYLPARVMIDAATVWMPYRVDRAVWLLSMCVGLAICVRFWSLLGVDPNSPAAQTRVWLGPALLGLGAVGSYLQRDLAECGLQIALLCMLTGGLAALLRGRPGLCGFSLGLAVAYKLTPLLFLPFLLWKRQWKAAAWMGVWTVLISLAPALYLGWQGNVSAHRQWLDFTIKNMTLEDPSENGVEPPVMHNQALALAIARLFQAYPSDHPLRESNVGLVQFAQLSAHDTKLIVQGALLMLAGALAWRFRRPVDTSDGGVSLGAEWSAVCILSAILSPLCWLQHLMLVVPAVLLIARTLATGRAQRWQWGATGLILAITLLIHRDLLGKTITSTLTSCSPHTVATLLMVLLTLTSSPASQLALATEKASTWKFARRARRRAPAAA